MNCYNYFDKSLILQQQMIIQQMLVYTQMLQAQQVPQIAVQAIYQQKIEESDNHHSFMNKHDDTHPIQPNTNKPKQKRQKKQLSKQPKKQQDVQNAENEPPQKKKVFLSMLDIKEAQYKKFKVAEKEIASLSDQDHKVPSLN